MGWGQKRVELEHGTAPGLVGREEMLTSRMGGGWIEFEGVGRVVVGG